MSLFQRRELISTSHRIAGWFWPRIGWRRAIRYYWHRLHRMHGTSVSIAAGLACGVGSAFSPLIGTHFVLAILLAWVVRGNAVAAVIGTFVVNPWTAPPVWFATYYLGSHLLGIDEGGADAFRHFVAMFRDLTEAAFTLDGELFRTQVWPVLLPMLVGSVPLGMVSGLATYLILEPTLRMVQARRRARLGAR
jgi:uncharacterized protein (DUF2062 family)